MQETITKALEIVKGRLPSLTVHADMQKAAQAVLNLAHAKEMYASSGSKPTEEMDEELTFVLGRVRPNLTATDMQQVTQAVLHLMQANQLLISIRVHQGKQTPKKQGASAA